MKNDKYSGIIPAFYATYDDLGNVSPKRSRELVNYFIDKKVQGLYIGGSSGECIYQTLEERKKILESVMDLARGKITIIAHVACNNTRDSCELAKHAEEVGVDAIASIPPIYFRLPEYAIADYWNTISNAAPNTDFIIYNIPQLAGVSLTIPLLKEMLKNPRLVGVKNSSMSSQDIQMFKAHGGKNFRVLNGPDEQLISGLAIGASGGIGGTYGAMPDLYLKIFDLFTKGEIDKARQVQYEVNEIIYKMCSGYGNMYAMIKEIIKLKEGIDIGSVRSPLTPLNDSDKEIAKECLQMIKKAEDMIKKID